MIYEGWNVDEKTPVQYVGVYVTKWRPEWGQPTVMFSQAGDVYQAAPEMLEALKEIATGVCKDDIEAIRLLAKATIDRAQGGTT